jgi:hypothetical protein
MERNAETNFAHGRGRLVRHLLETNIYLAWVTTEERGKLNKRFPHRMPPGADTFPWKSPWARNKESEIELLSP